jgi:hypothetical protein
MEMKGLKLFAVTTVLLGLTACAPPSTNVRYGDARAVETLNADFGSTDMQLIAEKMVTSLLETGSIRNDVKTPNDPPVVSVTRIKNRTSEHIDTKSISDKIRTTLIRSGKVRFAASDMQDDLIDQVEQQSAMASKNTRKNFGQQVGAKYILGGEIMSIVKQAGREKDVFYKITLNLVDIESGVIVWADEKEIRKGTTRRLLGG